MKRRQFLELVSAVATLTIVPRHVLGGQGHTPPSEKLNIAGVGVGGQGAGDLREMASENIVALCDVDWQKAARTFQTYPKASPLKKESYPAWEIITYEFAAKGSRPAMKIVWYDGGRKPPRPNDLDDGVQLGDNGIHFVGEKGTMLCGGWSGAPELFPKQLREAFQKPPATLPRSPGHRAEWIQACKAHKPEGAKAGFAYSGPFTEALLVGILAVRLQKRIEWDAAAMKATKVSEADVLIRKPYRKGFALVNC